jgi:hypothetical protein
MRYQRAFFLAVGLFPIAVAVSAACSAGPSNNAGGFGGQGGGNGGSGASGTAGSGAVGANGGNGQGGFGGVGQGGSGGIKEDAACATVSAEAKAQLQPADIIIAVDTSGSMDQEIQQVQANLNNFASIITGSGIDAHVILIADATMCIPAPLGSGQCNGADEKLPTYRHVVQTVASTDGLQVILQTYPQWKDSLRPGASKTIAIVTDDDSSMPAGDFTTQLLGLDPPTFQGFKFHAIASNVDPDDITFTCLSCAINGMFSCNNCMEKCCDKMIGCSPLPADKGTVYIDLVNQTGGIFGDLCIQDFGPVFQDMATGVVQSAQLSCEYAIPMPPEGETLDPNEVNVNYTPTGQMPKPILNVKTPADCGVQGGWYYDDPAAPKKIIMCPSTCDTLKADATGKVDVLFGCETVIKPPE